MNLDSTIQHIFEFLTQSTEISLGEHLAVVKSSTDYELVGILRVENIVKYFK